MAESLRPRWLKSGRGFPTVTGLLAACASPSATESCGGMSTELPGAICVNMDAGGDLELHRDVFEMEVERAVEVVREIVPVTDLTVFIIADPVRVIPEIGIGGFAPSGSEVRIFGDPSLADVPGIFQRGLLGILSDELHHVFRWRAIGYGSTLLRAAVSEGLADHFALEVTRGSPAPWAIALTPEELEV